MQTKRFLSVLTLLVLVAACAGSDGDPAAAQARATDPIAPVETEAPTVAPQKQFPALDYLQQIPVAYRVANDHPEMLVQIPCYCPCELYGHGGILDCYRSQHAAACATCLEEAVLAGQLLEQAGGGSEAYAEIAAEVKNRFRSAIVSNHLQNNDMPNLQSGGGRAYLTVCSDCHQVPHPAMYTADNWRKPLSRMQAYANQRGVEIDPAQWEATVSYIRSTSAQFPASTGDEYRASLARAVAHLKEAEGESVYYPGVQDRPLDPAWFERMVEAYRLARDIPAEVLAATPIEDPSCSTLLECLNSSAAVTSEAAVEAVFRIADERSGGD